MRGTVLVLGSGKMARDVGGFLMERGHRRLSWISRDEERLAALQRQISRRRRRLARTDPDLEAELNVTFHLPGDSALPAPDAVVECINESLQQKREALAGIQPLLKAQTLVASTSSSILPWEILPRCVGLHFFYPLQLTGLVEVIAPPEHPGLKRALAWMGELDLQVMLQDESSAFAANRLLLPCQAECFRLLRQGCDAKQVDAASRSRLLPMGLLSGIDAIGVDVVHAAVGNYLGRLPDDEARDYRPLQEGLDELLALGKQGTKNKDGLLRGAPLPWSAEGAQPDLDAALQRRLLYLLLHTCQGFVAGAQLTPAQLDLVTDRLLSADVTVDELLAQEGHTAVQELMARLYRESGLSYFSSL